MGSPIFLVLIPIFLGFGVIIAALFLRAAISLANQVFKPAPILSQPANNLPLDPVSEMPATETTAKDTPAPVNPFARPSGTSPTNKPSDNNPYAAPQNYGYADRASDAMELAIPEPSFGKACGIVLMHSLAGLLISVFLHMALAQLGGVVLLLPILVGFFISIFIYGVMLPTTPGRAVVIYLFQLLLMVLASAVFVAGILALLTLAE